MTLFVLDTDHISLLQRGHPGVIERFNQIPENSIAASIITYEEQLIGAGARISSSRLTHLRV